METILDEIVRAERMAEEMIRKAREAQAEGSQSVEEEAGGIIQEARSVAAERMKRRITEAQDEARQSYRKAVEAAEEESRRRNDGVDLQEVVDRVVEILVRPAYEGNGRE